MLKLLTGIFLLTSFHVFSQKAKITVSTHEKSVGYNSITGKAIIGTQYEFPDQIKESYIDTLSATLTVQLRGLSKNGKWMNNKGSIVLYNLNDKSILWTKKIVYQTASLQQSNNTMIFTSMGKSHCLDFWTGEDKYELKNSIYYIDQKTNIGMGYKYRSSTGVTNILEGINLTNGNVLWQRNINRTYGWNDLRFLDDTTLLLVADGLHTIQLKDGKGWDFDSRTGIKDYSTTLATNSIAAVAGMFTGYFYITYGHNLIRDLASNVIVDDAAIYFASSEQISRLEKKNGSVVWSNPFPRDLVSMSSLFKHKDMIIMVNYGYSYMENRQMEIGLPFIAAFNAESGQQIFLSTVLTEKDPILSFQAQNDTLAVIFKKRIALYSLSNGLSLYEKEFKTAETGELEFFVGNNAYVIDRDSSYVSLALRDSKELCVHTNKGYTLLLDEGLHFSTYLADKYIFTHYLTMSGYKFISNGKRTIVLNKDHKKIALFNASVSARLMGNKIYNEDGNSIWEIDLTELLDY
ncbi:MAG: PQQ-binding-like beta-propeller repeat protein [Bacteroidales bacterium]|nr:PQQ-binding-like beta-propeller repeat protein [Bacteroidales bacterium]MCF8404506.1 PQQ-binding-like beta-propeller repeat protein [Bacteroidales bacterium]